jgi:hypothetical protein
MALPIYPVCHDVPSEYGLQAGYDFIRQSPVVLPEVQGMRLSDVFSPTLQAVCGW